MSYRPSTTHQSPQGGLRDGLFTRGVYIVGEVGRIDRRVKIGMTEHLPTRLSALSSGSSCAIELLMWWEMRSASTVSIRNLEKQVQRRWSHLRVHGEWYFAAADLACYLLGDGPAYRRESDLEVGDAIQQAAMRSHISARFRS